MHIFTENYVSDQPLLEITVSADELHNKIKLFGYLDTGATHGLSMNKEQLEKLNLQLPSPVNPFPLRLGLADGTCIAGDIYEVIIELKSEKICSTLLVMDPSKKLECGKDDDQFLIGRGVFDFFQVTFDAISNPKKFIFSK